MNATEENLLQIILVNDQVPTKSEILRIRWQEASAVWRKNNDSLRLKLKDINAESAEIDRLLKLFNAKENISEWLKILDRFESNQTRFKQYLAEDKEVYKLWKKCQELYYQMDAAYTEEHQKSEGNTI